MSACRPVPVTILFCLATLISLLAPHPLAARDCGADYLACLWDAGALGSSEQIHEAECWGEYLACAARMLRVY